MGTNSMLFKGKLVVHKKINCRIGWFNAPGLPGSRATKTHIVDGNNKPICGVIILPKKEFQWCTQNVTKGNLDYIECKKCLYVTKISLEE